MKDFRLKIKPQRGITYECYRGFSDYSGAKARRGQRYALLGEVRSFYLFIPISGRGYSKQIRKEKFISHFTPVNPLECCEE